MGGCVAAWTMVCAIVLLAATAGAAHARERLAFVVGNAGYSHAPALRNPVNDARLIAEALRRAGFHVIEGQNLTRRAFEDKIKEFAQNLPAAREALFYFAGHGIQVAGQNYLIPVDAKLAAERDLAFETIPLDLIQSQMELDRADKTSIIVLDACRDNPFTRSLATAMRTRSGAVQRGLAQVQAGSGTFIAFSTKPNDTAEDGSGDNSPFSSSLARRMLTPGRPLASLMIDVRNDVRRATNNAQTPWDHSSLTGEFYFVPPASGGVAAAPVTAPPDYDAIRRRNQELESRLAAITEARSGGGPAVTATGAGGCMIVERGFRNAVPVERGSRLCSRDGVNQAEVRLVNKYAIVYSVGGRDTTCKPQDVCQFSWSDAPLFRVQLSEGTDGKVAATLVPYR